MNHFEKFNKINRFFEFFCAYFGAKDWRYSNMIWGAL